MGFDIGLKTIDQRYHSQEVFNARMKKRLHWLWDMVTVWSIRDITPTFDPNMMRIYADTYRRDITNLNDEQLRQLATSYQQAIKVFVYQNLFNEITKISRKWRAFAENSVATNIFSIPTNSLTMFDNLLTLHKQNPDADDTLQFNALKSSLFRNSEEWFKAWNEDFDISKYIVPKERMFAFMDIVDRKVQACYQKTNSKDSIALDYHTKIQNAIDYLKVLLLIVHQAKIERKDDILEEMKFLFPVVTDLIPRELLAEATVFAKTYGNLPISHLVCLDTDTSLDLHLEQVDMTNVCTLEPLYAFVKYIQSHKQGGQEA